MGTDQLVSEVKLRVEYSEENISCEKCKFKRSDEEWRDHCHRHESLIVFDVRPNGRCKLFEKKEA